MDTKLKNIKYSMAAKVVAVILAWISFLAACGSGFCLLYNWEIVDSSSYKDTQKYYSEYSRLIHNTVDYFIKLKSVEDIKASGKGAKDIQENLNRYNSIKTRLSEQVNFAYYIRDTITGEVITNISSKDPIALLQSQESTSHFYKDGVEYKEGILFYIDDIQEMLSGTSYEVYTAVMEPLKEGDVFYDSYVSYSKTKTMTNYAIYLLIASLILMLLALVFLVFAAGHKVDMEELVLTYVDRIYVDVHSLMVFIAAIISTWIASMLIRLEIVKGIIPILIILGIDFFIGLSYFLSMVRQIKAEKFRYNFLIYKIYKKFVSFIKLSFNGKVFRVQILILLLLYTLINIVFSVLIFHFTYYAINRFYDGYIHIFLAFLLFSVNGFVFYQTAKALRSLAIIMEGTKTILNGNLDYKLDTTDISVAFLAFAENIQGIQGGLKGAVDKAIKGERMKTDLITNVSHDLKTPLTSIINYVDLLKREELDNIKAMEYVNILDEKSERLKVLIEDLVEASKASSGNLPVNTEKVDLHQLVMQASGEYLEKIEKVGLDIRTNASDKNIFIQADGKHMWRIIENLLSNVLKYSMVNSRVYINITKNETYGILTVKNISAAPLEIPVDQLTERFIRGDVSRTTEGSGLGLSIAQSLTNLQKGKFNIEIDGDLFKVTVEIPLCNDLL